MQQKISAIYLIVNQINKKQYVGSSTNVIKRLKQHLWDLKRNAHGNKKLQKDFNELGETSFSFEIFKLIPEDQLIEEEQKILDSTNKKNLYNMSMIAGSGGGDTIRIPMYLIDLKGNIIASFNSGVALCKYINKKGQLNYSNVNTPSVLQKKYRVVTKVFYHSKYNVVKTWKPYSNEAIYKKELALKRREKPKYQLVMKDGTQSLHYTQKTISDALSISSQRVSQMLKVLENEDSRKYFSRKHGFSILLLKKMC